MRQTLFKAISCIALMVSVFFCTSTIVLADETSSDDLIDGDIAGQVVIEGTSQEYDLSTSAELGSYDYTGVTSIHTQKTYGWVQYSNLVGNGISSYHGLYTFDTSVPVLFRMAVERGHTYSGQIYFMLHVNFPDLTSESITKVYRGVNISGFEQQSSYDGVSVSYYGFVNFGDADYSGTCDVTVCVTFDNFQPTFSGDLNVNSMFNISGAVQTRSTINENFTAAIWPVFDCTLSSDWAGELYDYPTDAIVDSDGTLIKNQTIQQQQIANQQSQQSAQQHEDLKEGFTDNTYNNNVSNAGSQVDSYIDLEHNLLEQQNQQMSDYADTAFNLNTISPYINAIAMTSTFFTWIWNGFGEMSVVFVIVLAIGVACLILGIRRRG